MVDRNGFVHMTVALDRFDPLFLFLRDKLRVSLCQLLAQNCTIGDGHQGSKGFSEKIGSSWLHMPGRADSGESPSSSAACRTAQRTTKDDDKRISS